MLKNKLFLAVLLFAIILAASVSAYYTVELGEYHTSSESITRSEFEPHTGLYTACAGETNIIPIWIVNKQDTKQFKFELRNIDFASLSGKEFNLNPEQEGVIFITLEPPVGLKRNMSFDLNIYTNRKLTLQLPIELNVEHCYEVGVEIKEEKDSICGCEPIAYDVEIENKGKSNETFGIYLNAPDFVNLGREFVEELNKTTTVTEKSVLISAGDTFIQTINISHACDVTGTYTIGVYAELERGKEIKDYDTLELNIHSNDDCDMVSVIARDIKVDRRKYFHPIKIRNIGTREATYSMSIDAPPWVSIERDSLTLIPEQEKETYLTLNITDEVEPNIYPVKILLNTTDSWYAATFNVQLKGENKLIVNIRHSLNYYKYYIIFAVILVIAFLVLVPLIKKAMKTDEFKKFEKEAAKTSGKVKKSKKLVCLISVLAVLFVLFLLFAGKAAPFLSYYRYYLLLLIVTALVVWLLVKFVVPKIKKKKPAEKKVEAKIVEKKIIEKKIVKRKPEKKKKALEEGQKKVWSFVYIAASVTALAALLIYSLSMIFAPLKSFFMRYLCYILIGVGALFILIIVLLLVFRKTKLKKKKKEKKATEKGMTKKEAKKTKKSGKKSLKRLLILFTSLVVLAGIIYSFIYFNLLEIVRNFVMIYLYYIIAGSAILILIIIILNHGNKVSGFFSKKKE